MKALKKIITYISIGWLISMVDLALILALNNFVSYIFDSHSVWLRVFSVITILSLTALGVMYWDEPVTYPAPDKTTTPAPAPKRKK